MPDKPSPESVERAARLRAQIDKLIHPGAAPKDQSPETTEKKRPMSPHEFIQREMDKLDRKK